MNVPNKVKHFAWKKCKNILAMKENLWRRNITKDNTCEVCKKQVESIGQLFWFCDHAKEVVVLMQALPSVRDSSFVGLYGCHMALTKVGGVTTKNFGANCHDLLGDMER